MQNYAPCFGLSHWADDGAIYWERVNEREQVWQWQQEIKDSISLSTHHWRFLSDVREELVVGRWLPQEDGAEIQIQTQSKVISKGVKQCFKYWCMYIEYGPSYWECKFVQPFLGTIWQCLSNSQCICPLFWYHTICIKLPNRYTRKKWEVQVCALHTRCSKELKANSISQQRAG